MYRSMDGALPKPTPTTVRKQLERLQRLQRGTQHLRHQLTSIWRLTNQSQLFTHMLAHWAMSRDKHLDIYLLPT